MDDGLQFRIFALLFQNGQALQHREACGTHGREHAGESGNVGMLDTGADFNLDFCGLFL